MKGSSTINAVLFDLDGTILDTANDLGAALNYVLTKFEMPLISEEAFRPIASDGAKGLLTLGFGEQLANHNFEALRTLFLNYYEDNIATHTCLYPGIAELIQYLDNHNIVWGIVTNKPEGLTHKLLPYFPELNNTQAVIGGDSLSERKPHPLPLTHALSLIKANNQECLYVGDAPRDIEAGNAANMPTVIAGWGYISDLNVCRTWQADHFTLTPLEIIELVKE